MKKVKSKNQKSLLIILVIFLFIINYNFLDKKLSDFLAEEKTGVVERVIDGDTLVLESGEHIRLLGINTPEKGEPYSKEAKDFAEQLALNKTITLKFGKERTDLYNRTLAYVFLENRNINLELVKEGLANYYFPGGKDVYYEKFSEAWKMCMEKNENLCEKSEDVCSNCILLKELNAKSDEIVFENACSYECSLANWSIKDEGRKHFIFPEFALNPYSQVKVIVKEGEDNSENLYWKGEDYVLTPTGDTLFLRDSWGKLVLWKTY